LPDHLEGTSFVPLLRRPERSWKSAVFSQYLRAGHMGYSMKTAQHHFILWQNQASGRNVALELYDHEQDPGETLNLAHQVEQRALVQKCMGQLSAGWRAALPE
jgi:iduronate 2-sulfatase